MALDLLLPNICDDGFLFSKDVMVAQYAIANTEYGFVCSMNEFSPVESGVENH